MDINALAIGGMGALLIERGLRWAVLELRTALSTVKATKPVEVATPAKTTVAPKELDPNAPLPQAICSKCGKTVTRFIQPPQGGALCAKHAGWE
jgi:hypothetical protein